MRKRTASPIHAHRKATICLMQLSPFQYYMEEELAMEEVCEKLIDCTGEQFFASFNRYNQKVLKHGPFKGVYYYNSYFSSIFLIFNDSFYKTFRSDCFYAVPTSLAGLSTLLVKEHYPNETEYLKTVSYLDNLVNFKEGSSLVEFTL